MRSSGRSARTSPSESDRTRVGPSDANGTGEGVPHLLRPIRPRRLAQPHSGGLRPALLQPNPPGFLPPSAPGPLDHRLRLEHADQSPGRPWHSLRPGLPVQPRLCGRQRSALAAQWAGLRRGLLSGRRPQGRQGNRICSRSAYGRTGSSQSRRRLWRASTACSSSSRASA